VRKNIGYCSEKNIVINKLTLQENMRVIGLIKGLHNESIREQTDFLVHSFSLGEFKCLTENLSGGNKRKLCAGMSIIGSPCFLFLDELTTGVDPISKINITRVLKRLKNHSIILSTHRLEEAEGLCD
jgi:ABC-type multidrug transport system ATPase subunit